jgi:hypothetical protein
MDRPSVDRDGSTGTGVVRLPRGELPDGRGDAARRSGDGGGLPPPGARFRCRVGSRRDAGPPRRPQRFTAALARDATRAWPFAVLSALGGIASPGGRATALPPARRGGGRRRTAVTDGVSRSGPTSSSPT